MAVADDFDPALLCDLISTKTHRIHNLLQSVESGRHLVDLVLRRGNTSVIEEGLSSEDALRLQRGWATVSDCNETISRLIRNLVVLSKPLELSNRRTSIVDTLQQLVVDLKPVLAPTLCKIVGEPTEVTAVIDPHQLSLAVENLIVGTLKPSLLTVSVHDPHLQSCRFVEIAVLPRANGNRIALRFQHESLGNDTTSLANRRVSAPPDPPPWQQEIEFRIADKIVVAYGGRLSVVQDRAETRIMIDLP